MSTYNSGIDYGQGQTNIDTDTGIRYGVISANDLVSYAWETIYSEGTDLDYADATESLKDDLARAIRSAIEDYATNFDERQLAESIIDDLEIDCQSDDCSRYQYDRDGLTFYTCSDGDIFITHSPFYSLCSFCSPCAPGAGHLRTEGSVKTYCLGPDWFDSDRPMPYQCFNVSDDSPVAQSQS